MDGGFAFVAHAQAAELAQPGEGVLSTTQRVLPRPLPCSRPRLAMSVLMPLLRRRLWAGPLWQAQSACTSWGLRLGRLEPLYLPPHSRDRNPIEKRWLVIKAEWLTDFVLSPPTSSTASTRPCDGPSKAVPRTPKPARTHNSREVL